MNDDREGPPESPDDEGDEEQEAGGEVPPGERPVAEPEPAGGPNARERSFLAQRFARARPKRETTGEAEAERPPVPGPLPTGFRRQMVERFRERQRAKQQEETAREEEGEGGEPSGEEGPEAESGAGTRGAWTPIGPSVLRRGQGEVQPATSGRVAGIAVTPGGARVYVASANGGVWRSDDTGRSWLSLMEGFDLNPTTVSSDSLACGAIAIVPGSPDRIYVGSGEGNGGAYFGVGPIVSRDGGRNWRTEEVASGSPPLAGSAFYSLAVDPADPDRVVAGTRQGLYRREPAGSGKFRWARKTIGASHTWIPSVVLARKGSTTTFYAARWGGPVYRSTDGSSWSVVGTGFPSSGVSRVGLAVQPGNPDVVYALVARSPDGLLHGVYRLDVSDNTWRQLSGAPADLFGTPPRGQGTYDLVIAVDPNDVNRIYLGGSTRKSGGATGEWSGSLWRCRVSTTGPSPSVTPTYIGGSIHADVHAMAFAPGDSNKLWVGCDGGVFYSTTPGGTGHIFGSRNAGLSTLTINHLGPHPTEDAVMFAGTQDNGGIRYTGDEAWLYSSDGDAGFQVVHWGDPYKVLSSYVRGVIRRSTNGGQRRDYGTLPVPLATDSSGNPIEPCQFYAPLVGTPPSSNASDADIVAFGSIRPWISTTFGGGWRSIPSGTLTGDRLNAEIASLAFASATTLYAGTMNGSVYRFDRSGTTWTRTQIDTIGGANSLPITAVPVTDIAIDLGDATGRSIYITFGGTGDYRHVWRFDGSRWHQRSGPSAGHRHSLLDVQASAIVVDPNQPRHLYVGADIGVWRSTDAGATWTTFSEGLPDAAVLDMRISGRQKLLWAATHGRGVYERPLDARSTPSVELYLRDTFLDRGLRPTVDGLPDPTAPGRLVAHHRSPGIRLDPPDAAGRRDVPAGPVDFLQFVDQLRNGARNVALPTAGGAGPRVHVLVHNRGVRTASGVRVMLLATHPSLALPALPNGFDANVRAGTGVSSTEWRTVGSVTLRDVRAGLPRVASFDLSPGGLAPPANALGGYPVSVLALVHHESDQFRSSEVVTDRLVLADRKASSRSFACVQWTGSSGGGRVVPIRLHNPGTAELVSSLVVRLPGFDGAVRLFIPALRFKTGDLRAATSGATVGADFAAFRTWATDHLAAIRNARSSGRGFDPGWSTARGTELERATASGLMLRREGTGNVQIRGIALRPGEVVTMFLVLDRPAGMGVGRSRTLEVIQTDDGRRVALGGLGIRADAVPVSGTSEEAVRLPLSEDQLVFLDEFATQAEASLETVVTALVDALQADDWIQEQTRRRIEVG